MIIILKASLKRSFLEMKICVVDEIANCGFNIAKGLGERDHEVLVLLDRAKFRKRFRFTQETPKNVRVKWLTPLPIRPRALGLVFPLLREIIRFKPQLIHVNYLWTQLFISQIAAWMLRIPVVGVGHGWEVLIVPYSKGRGFIQRFFLKRVDRIILTAEYYLHELTIIPEDKKVFIDRVIDTDVFNPNIDDSEVIKKYGENIVTFVARLFKCKSPYTVIRAFRLVTDQIPDVQFIFLGKGPERKSMENLVRKLSLNQNVHFLGEIPNSEVRKYLKASKVEVHGFHKRLEEIGISHLEAMACATPVISYYPKDDIPGVINATDSSTIAQAILNILNDQEYDRKISQGARKSVVDNFSIQKATVETLRLYADIFKERGLLEIS